MKHALSQSTNRSNLIYISSLLNSIEIEWCVFFGTLLGLVRDGDIIPNDDDIDIYVPIQQRDNLLNLLLEAGIVWDNNPPNHTDYFLQIKRNFAGEIGVIDFYFIEVNLDSQILVDKWNFFGKPNNTDKFMHVPIDFVFPTVNTSFFNSSIKFPAKPTELVRWLYGENWNVPLDKKNSYRMHIKNNAPILKINRVRYSFGTLLIAIKNFLNSLF